MFAMWHQSVLSPSVFADRRPTPQHSTPICMQLQVEVSRFYVRKWGWSLAPSQVAQRGIIRIIFTYMQGVDLHVLYQCLSFACCKHVFETTFADWRLALHATWPLVPRGARYALCMRQLIVAQLPLYFFPSKLATKRTWPAHVLASRFLLDRRSGGGRSFAEMRAQRNWNYNVMQTKCDKVWQSMTK